MLGNIAKALCVLGMAIVGLLGLGPKLYASIGAIATVLAAILLFDSSAKRLRIGRLELLDENPALEVIWLSGFSILVGIFWPAVPVIATFGSEPADPSGRPGPSDEHRKS